ncbi:transcriptional regulator [Nocardioides sp. GY 10127]|nr:transcriptional regulator [Nocardioides sp. GY 10127]TIC81139.1 transcriptional regulator [Nocardioides sp. GY 10127]
MPPPSLELLDRVAWAGAALPAGRGPALLALLAAAGGRPVSEERLVHGLWDEDAVPASPTRALQVVVSRVRTQTSAEAVVRTPQGYRLGLADDDVDVLVLDVLARAAATATDEGDPDEAVRAARSALALPVGEAGTLEAGGPLAELRLEALATQARGRALLGRALCARGEHPEALPLLEQHVGGDGVDDEAAQAALLRSLAAVRGVPAALERYDGLRADLSDRLGIDPGPRLQELHAELLAADRPVREGLAHASTSLVGRDGDLRTLRGLLARHRVVSILGPGGLGKTRLAMTLAAEAVQPVVRVVELVGVTEPEGVLPELASVLGVRDSAGQRLLLTPEQQRDVRGRLAAHLGRAPTLLVLDNCEQVVAAVADVVAFLVAACPRLTVVTTTRAPLAIAAEAVLALPVLGREDAVRLFTERARAARPGVQLDPAEVAEVVARLDGLPLAVELAAAKVRVMSVAEVARRLQDRFALLRGNDRSAPDRHRTLLAVVDWSWDLLDDDGRAALCRLALFPDGFALDGADALLSGVLPGGSDPLDAVQALLDQSLLSLVEEGGREPRYRMLETVRELGLQRLTAIGDEVAARARLRGWAVALAERETPGLHGADQLAALDRLDPEMTTLAAELRGALDAVEREDAVRLLAALGAVWTIRGDHVRMLSLLATVEDVLAGWEPAPPDRDAALAASVAVVRNAVIAATLPTGAARELLRRHGEEASLPAVRAAARLLASPGAVDLAGAREHLAALVEHEDRRTRALALAWSCHARENSGDIAAAVADGEAALALWRPEDGPWQRVQTLSQLIDLHAQRGDEATVVRQARTVLPMLERLGAVDDCVQLLAVLGCAAITAGDLEEAEALLAETDRLLSGPHAAELGLRSSFGVGPLRAELLLAQGRVAEGLAVYREAVTDISELRLPGWEEAGLLAPWQLFAAAALTMALARHGRSGAGGAGEDVHADLRSHVDQLLRADAGAGADAGVRPELDVPLLGIVAFALGGWEVHRGPDAALPAAARLLRAAEAAGYNRYVPSLAWAPLAAELDGRAPGLLASVPSLALGEEPARRLSDEVGAGLAALDGVHRPS